MSSFLLVVDILEMMKELRDAFKYSVYEATIYLHDFKLCQQSFQQSHCLIIYDFDYYLHYLLPFLFRVIIDCDTALQPQQLEDFRLDTLFVFSPSLTEKA